MGYKAKTPVKNDAQHRPFPFERAPVEGEALLSGSELTEKGNSLGFLRIDCHPPFSQPVRKKGELTLHYFSGTTKVSRARVVHGVIRIEQESDSRLYRQVVRVYKVQNGAEDRSLRNAGGDGSNG